jgi:large subunit ribosomal protein L11
MAKTIKTVIKLQIPAGKANPAPPVGPALAPHGLNMSEICQKFNNETKDMQGVIPTVVTVYEDRSYDLKIKQPLSSYLIKKAVGIEKGSGEPNKKKVGEITDQQLEEIAKKKMPDLNTQDLEQAKKIIAATAKNMGVTIKK